MSGRSDRDRSTRGRLIVALREAGIQSPQKIADAVASMINTKIESSEGKHYAKCHKTKPMDEAAAAAGKGEPEHQARMKWARDAVSRVVIPPADHGEQG
jgi:hypothetical protein